MSGHSLLTVLGQHSEADSVEIYALTEQLKGAQDALQTCRSAFSTRLCRAPHLRDPGPAADQVLH